MSRDGRLATLEQVFGPEKVMIRVLRVPAHRWRAEPALSADEIRTYTHRVLGPFGAAS